MNLENWASDAYLLLVAILAASSLAASVVASVGQRGLWWRGPLAFVFPLFVCFVGCEHVSYGSGPSLRQGALTLVVFAAFRLAWTFAITRQRGSRQKGAALLIAALPLAAAITLVPKSNRAATQIHDDITVMKDKSAVHAIDAIREAAAKNPVAFQPAGVRVRSEVEVQAVATSNDGWAAVIVAHDCPLCRSWYLDSTGLLTFAEGRAATKSDAAPDPADIERMRAGRQPKPKSL